MKTEHAGNEAKISVRDKILLTAHDLFYSNGFRATGVDTLIKEAKVTKVTFYRHFPSKSLLILAYLHYRHEIWISWFETTLRRHLDEGEIPSDAISATLYEWFISPEFHGCAFINASAEAKSEDIESEIKAICRGHKIETKNMIALLTKIADERVVNEIMLLIDGAIIHAQMGMDSETVINVLKRGLEALTGQK
ncbi:TPA: TetR/AcrR family transcriptional regulator [Enterobacter bugandensis]|uniref:TetR family transcriptional Regulator n=1 Tax=Enterobacter bugandensis TaxID=881260 RepID=A0A822WJZ1_9ENTR|nr:TetR/AcrR family transcriptional regulator [Enterobacter bugandensis]MBE3208622.1 TetR/AcrR family transcriptional regulator [Enterobacter cloacae complex sp. P32C]MBE3463187.1 TetR/AcrR family transcriptional regulator [Enterobacter cloacae complex sp. P20C]MBE3472026.1 TetR/AcrR family transcriptional regulator [Enterobacter cloacae complex sp. P20B]MBE3493670.1 TetR/AcrR family transcriptional regulator [Enterobacter cloacae complex sp. P17RS]MBE3509522.1 TetR/AcrR family transcriptional